MRRIVIWAAFAALFALIAIQGNRIQALQTERDKYARNTDALLTDVENYKTRDSLNAARVGVLELQLSEFERYREADAALIRSLQMKNRELQDVTTAQLATIVTLSEIPKDTVVLIDSIPVPATVVHSGDEWYQFDGVMTEGHFAGTLAVYDSLLSVETVQYKRFLLWKTKKVKNRNLDIISKCPYTTIQGVEHVIIEN